MLLFLLLLLLLLLLPLLLLLLGVDNQLRDVARTDEAALANEDRRFCFDPLVVFFVDVVELDVVVVFVGEEDEPPLGDDDDARMIEELSLLVEWLPHVVK